MIRSLIPNALGFLTIIAGSNYVQAEESGPLRYFPHAVKLGISFERTKFETHEPIIARVTLTNLSERAFRVELRRNGPPVSISLEVASIDQPYRSYALWLRRTGPEREEIELQPGESTVGDILVLLNYGKGKYVFPNAGTYRVRCCWLPAGGFVKVYSDEFQVKVVPSSAVNNDVLTELERIAMKYHDIQLSVLNELKPSVAKKELEREGLLVLARIVRQRKPHLVIPERYPSQQREGELVKSLEDLLERHPNTSYSGYIARFLGLVYVKTFEHEISHAGGEHWGTEKMRAHPAYPKALQYLTKASETELWPRTTALINLSKLHGMAKEWNKVSQCLTALRTRYADVDGKQLADGLQREMNKFRTKVERHKRASPSE